MIVTGSDHAGFTPAQARAAARLIPNGQAAIMADAAYLAPLETPTTTTTLIDFWAEVAAEPPPLDRRGGTGGPPPGTPDPLDRERQR